MMSEMDKIKAYAPEAYITKDDGQRVVMPTGALRSDSTGKGRYDLISPHAMRRLAQVYERGGIQKGDKNWELGFPCSRAASSAIRHCYQWLEGLRDEDHLAQAMWNIACVIHFEEEILLSRLPSELLDTRPERKRYER